MGNPCLADYYPKSGGFSLVWTSSGLLARRTLGTRLRPRPSVREWLVHVVSQPEVATQFRVRGPRKPYAFLSCIISED